MSTSGIKASGLGSRECVKKIILKDAASYGPRKAKLTYILDVEDCRDIVHGIEVEPNKIASINDLDKFLGKRQT